MKEGKAFWLLSAVFVLACVGILLFSHLNMEREAVYFTPIEASSQSVYEQEALSTEFTAKNTVSNDKININTASAEELATLPGIGEKTAEAIITYRKEFGPFDNIEEITEVNGIGKTKYNNIKDFITA